MHSVALREKWEWSGIKQCYIVAASEHITYMVGRLSDKNNGQKTKLFAISV